MPDLLESMRRGRARQSTATARSATGSTSAGTTTTRTANEIFEARRAQFLGDPDKPRPSRSGATSDVTQTCPIGIRPPLAVLAAYLIGSIPFGYLIAYWVRGIDIRTVGSGNIGATNVGRVLGFRYFLLVFALDLLKGFLPTFGFRWIVDSSRASILRPTCRCFVALAAILGTRSRSISSFEGGKGVATSLGAVLALDPSPAARRRSASSPSSSSRATSRCRRSPGASSFVAAHFAFAAEPWSRENLAMSLLSIAIATLLIVRHHKNLSRVLAGTEPKVSLRRSRADGA